MNATKITILLPVNYNDGGRIPQVDINTILDDICNLAGGFTQGCCVQGCYRMKDGSLCKEPMIPVVAIVTYGENGLPRSYPFQYVAARAARLFQQETVYFETQEVDCQFING
jgi:hypothetical protein